MSCPLDVYLHVTFLDWQVLMPLFLFCVVNNVYNKLQQRYYKLLWLHDLLQNYDLFISSCDRYVLHTITKYYKWQQSSRFIMQKSRSHRLQSFKIKVQQRAFVSQSSFSENYYLKNFKICSAVTIWLSSFLAMKVTNLLQAVDLCKPNKFKVLGFFSISILSWQWSNLMFNLMNDMSYKYTKFELYMYTCNE